jgi:hypothetical protein
MARYLELPVSQHCIRPSDRSDPEVSGLLCGVSADRVHGCGRFTLHNTLGGHEALWLIG